MSQYIKTFVKIRPALPTDSGTGGSCLTLKSDESLEVKRPGEALRSFDKVLNPDTTDFSSLWDLAGAPSLEAVREGKQALIYVYGETHSGKTHVVRGPPNPANAVDANESLCGRLCAELGGQEDANLCVIYFHNDVPQDLVTGADNLKVKNDGGVVEGATTIRLTSKDAGLEHIKKCITKRNELMAAVTPAVFHESLTFLVFQFALGQAGRVTIVECCGSERCFAAPASLGPDMNREVTNKNKLLAQLSKCWIDSATNADPKALPWKDTKLGRMIQPGLGAAMDQTGFAAQIVCVLNHMTRVWETLCSIQYAEASVKQETLKTVSEYKELLAVLEERLDGTGKEKPPLLNEMNAEEANAKKVKAENEARIEELTEKSRAFDQKIAATKAQYAKEIEKLKKDIEAKAEALNKKNNEEIDRMRNLAKNAPAQAAADIRKKVAEVEEEHKQNMAKTQAETTRLKTEIRNVQDEVKDLKLAKEQQRLDEIEAMKPVKELEKELFKMKANMTFATKNREDGLTPEELLAKRPLWEVRDELDDVDEEMQKMVPEFARLEAIVTQKVGKPPTPEPSEPSEASAASDSESEASVESEKPPPETKEERLARLERERIERRSRRAEAKADRIAQNKYNKEWEHFRATVRKDFFLSDLLERIVQYLEFGLNIVQCTPKGCERNFICFNQKKKILLVYPPANPGDAMSPNRLYPCQRTIDLTKASGVHLGQHSPNFQIALRKMPGRVDPIRSEPPPLPDELENANLHRYYYRSMSIQMGSKEDGFFDMICDCDTDFEALIVALHRITGRNAVWGKILFIELAARVDDLSPQEKTFCENYHFTPTEYLETKRKVLLSPDLYVTLHDLRVLLSVDLYHCQRLLELWLRQRWIVRRQMNYYKYQEVLEEEKAAARARAEAEAEAAQKVEETEEAEEGEEEDDDDAPPPSDDDDD